MTPEQKATFINARVAMLNAEIAGMVAENMQRAAIGDSMAYTEASFTRLMDSYGDLYHNALIDYFRD